MIKRLLLWFVPSGDTRAIKRLTQLEHVIRVIIFALLLVPEFYFVFWAGTTYGFIPKAEKRGMANVAVINIDEAITPEFVKRVIDKMEEVKYSKKKYDHTLIEFNCPGGSPTASEELSYYLDEYQKDMNTTFYVSSSATSGAYMAACVADRLYAAPSAFVGSIGVYVQSVSLEGVMKKIGIKDTTIASHENKIPLSLFKDTTKENELYVKNNLLNPVYRNFFNLVKEKRGLSEKELTPLAEGRAFIATEVTGTLVDEITTLYAVRENIAKGLGVKIKNVSFIEANMKPTNNPFKSSFDINVKVPQLAQIQ